MSKSSRRVMQTTVAVVGMAAIGAVGSGTAFAQTATGLDRVPEGAGHTDLTGVEDGLGSAEEAGGVDLYSFQLPSAGEQTVKNSHHLAKKNKDSDDDSDKKSDKSDKKDSDDKSDKKDRSDSKKKSDKDDSDDDKDDDKGGKHRKKD